MNEILIVSHCILNNAAKVAQDESGLAEEYAQRDALMQAVADRGVQLIQLPCPEFILYGAKRWGHVKDQFDNPHFRAQCRAMLGPVMMQLEEYAGNPDRFNILGVVSVEGSPSCGHALTCRGDWGGEFEGRECENGWPASSVRMTNEPGVFMEVLEKMLGEHRLDIRILSISEAAVLIAEKQSQ